MKSGDGYTLLETVVSLALFATVCALVLPFVSLQNRLALERESFGDEFQNLAAAVSWVTSELQEAGYHCRDGPIQSLAAEAVVYRMSRDLPSELSVSNRRLASVYRRGQDLMYRLQRWDPETQRWSRGTFHVLASGLTALEFRGLDRAGSAAVGVEEVTAVEITLSGKRAGTLKTLVALRNRPVL